jgi:PhnB protein
MSIKPIPDGYHTLTPYLVVQGAAKLLAFLQQAFDATELRRMVRPDGTIADAEAKVGDSRIMVTMREKACYPCRRCSMFTFLTRMQSINVRSRRAVFH